LLVLVGGAIKVPRYLEPPIVRDRSVKAQEAQNPRKTEAIAQENRAALTDAEGTADR
jgi:hypothetical protein